MKRISIISFLTAAIAFGFASCADKAEEFKKGAPDADGCYGVYFPAQKTTLILDPSEPTVDTLKVARTKTEGAITVPYTFKGDSVFQTSELKFEDGQTESYIVVLFDSAQVGTTYKCSIILEDPAYASQYTSNAIAIDLSVTRDKWNSLGIGTYSDAFNFDGAYPVEILQNDKDKTKFRIMHPYDGAIEDRNGYDDENVDVPSEYISLYLLKPGNKIGDVSITEKDLVFFDEYSTGFYSTTYGAVIMVIHPADGFTNSEAACLWNKVLQYQDNGLPAGIQLAPWYYMYGVGGWNKSNLDGYITIIFPGAKLTDYSLEIIGDFAEDGEQDVAFVFGADVAFAEFATYEGALNDAQVQAKRDAIIAGEDSTVVTVDSTSVVTLSFPTTGEYTVVAVAYDADSVAQSYASEVLNYVAADDEVPVDIFAELVSTKKYERLGYSSDNSLEFTIYGSDLTDVSIGLFQTLKFNADTAGYIADVIDYDDYALSAKVIGQINDKGYTDLFYGLNPGTSYTLVVVASNGYEVDYTLATATTTGDPLPIFMDFDYTDIDDDLCPDTITGFEGSYDFYATRYFGESGMRELISTVEFKAINDSILMAVGLFGEDAAEDELHDTAYFQYYEGLLWTLPTAMYGDKGYHAAVNWYSTVFDDVFDWRYEYLMFGGFVDANHVAFVDGTGGYGFNGWALTAYTDSAWTQEAGLYDIYMKPLFVTSGYYDEGLTSVQTSSRLDKLSAALKAPRTNHVETDLGYIKSTISNLKNADKYVSYGTKAELEIEPEPRPVSAKIVSVKAYERAYERAENSFEAITKD